MRETDALIEMFLAVGSGSLLAVFMSAATFLIREEERTTAREKGITQKKRRA